VSGSESTSILNVFADDAYRLGDVQIIPYDRKRVDVFGTNYLHYLYSQCLLSRPTSPWGILPDLMCGMADLSSDMICSYLANKPIALLCVHTSPTEFTPAGFCWPTEIIRSPSASSAFCAFAIFRPYWGTPESTVLGMLGISYLYVTHVLTAIHGQRYASNALAAKWMRRFGAWDIGTIPHLLRTHKGTLESCTISTLLRVDFEQYVKRELLTLAGGGIQGGQGQHRSGIAANLVRDDG
jgi:hypothetical protein